MSHKLTALTNYQHEREDPEDYLRDLLIKHHQTRDEQIDNLLAADSFMSKQTLCYLSDPIAGHSAAGHIGVHNRYFAGTRYIDDIDSLCHHLCSDLFSVEFCEHRVLGGTQANMIVYVALLRPGDRVCVVSPQCGGDSSTHENSILSKLNVNIDNIPFTQDLSIDFELLEKQFKQHPYRLLSFGFSVSLIQPDFYQLIELCHRYGVICHIDCAHELALIANGLFPNPLKFGADIMTASTGKAFAGPPGGIILWNDKGFSEALVNHTFPFSVGGYQNNRVLALAQTLIEYKQGKKYYLKQAMQLSKLLADILTESGVSIARYRGVATCTHHLVIDCPKQDPRRVMHQLEENHILTSLAVIPLTNRVGLRLSTIQPAIRQYEHKDLLKLAFRVRESIF
ncbi:aminotransferase class V-fold PLP-dependent enzyme [Legionella sp. W05-934-2]|uniref:aminotransferase class V-fold PLP-dependent enzyme n=1 Tax=Legionella sp. W05-934-2 TaxID=1198649 RepID=UPI003461A499